MKSLDHWKLLADLNISVRTVQLLQSLSYDIKRIDKSVLTDEDVVKIAERENRTIITFDKDFGEIYYFHERKSFTVIILSIEDQTAEAVNRILQSFLTQTSFKDIQHKLVILYEGRYRIIG